MDWNEVFHPEITSHPLHYFHRVATFDNDIHDSDNRLSIKSARITRRKLCELIASSPTIVSSFFSPAIRCRFSWRFVILLLRSSFCFSYVKLDLYPSYMPRSFTPEATLMGAPSSLADANLSHNAGNYFASAIIQTTSLLRESRKPMSVATVTNIGRNRI